MLFERRWTGVATGRYWEYLYLLSVSVCINAGSNCRFSVCLCNILKVYGFQNNALLLPDGVGATAPNLADDGQFQLIRKRSRDYNLEFR